MAVISVGSKAYNRAPSNAVTHEQRGSVAKAIGKRLFGYGQERPMTREQIVAANVEAAKTTLGSTFWRAVGEAAYDPKATGLRRIDTSDETFNQASVRDNVLRALNASLKTASQPVPDHVHGAASDVMRKIRKGRPGVPEHITGVLRPIETDMLTAFHDVAQVANEAGPDAAPMTSDQIVDQVHQKLVEQWNPQPQTPAES